MIGKYLAYLVFIEALFMLPSIAVGILYNEPRIVAALVLSAGICVVVGAVLHLLCRNKRAPIYARESFVIAGAGWLLLSILGALPFFISGEIPHYVDALFEAISGLSTTGASILGNVDAMSRGLVFWRSFLHWMGGIGVLTFMLLVIRSKGGGTGFTLHFLRAEMPGPHIGKVLPRTQAFVRTIFAVYFGLSLLNLILLLAGGMPLFDAVCTTLGTAGTGGFNFHNTSIAHYSPYLQWVITIFMALFGTNFVLYFYLVRREWKLVARDEELRMYLGFFLGVTAVCAASLLLSGQASFGTALREAAFTTSSVITTTGYSITDTAHWPGVARTLLLIVMLFGSMAGSTGGGFKMIRILIIFKSLRVGLYRMLHPRNVKTVRVGGKAMDEEIVTRTLLFLCAWCGLAMLSVLLVALDGRPLAQNFTTVLSCINNIGPGPVTLGVTIDYNAYSYFSKAIFCVNMLMGRLEIFPVLLLFSPSTWRIKS